MGYDGAAKVIARWVALGALFLIPLTPLIVANSYFFPFITGKAFYFRILVEIAVAAWAVLCYLDREYRPRFSWIGGAALGFVAWMFIADATALNAAKAFWSNFERMEGWVLLIHLLGFFYAAGAVLRVEKKWRGWFLWSLLVSFYVCVYALMQLHGSLAIHQGASRIDATLGNSAYLAIYLLFNVFIALWLALTEKYSWLKWSLIALAVLEAVLIFFTATRGTIIGLVLALALGAFLTALTAGKSARGWATLAIGVIIVLVGGFYLERNSAFVQQNEVLQRVASISLADGQTRFTIWRMAFEGAVERPLTGWGQEGFNYIFNKYYDPSLYEQEQWFDRAHNAFIDWLTAGGFPAFILYISLFGSAIVLLWRRTELSRPERIALTAALAGYAVHNLFVFDNLYSYVYFFAILSLVDSQVGRPIERLEEASEITDPEGVSYALPAAAVIGLAVMWYVNFPGMGVATELITALSQSPDGVATNLAAFQDLAKHPAFAAQEIREQLVNFASQVARSKDVSDDKKQETLLLAITQMQKQVDAYPMDARERLELSYAYRAAGDSNNALKEILAAAELSPRKEAIWVEAGAVEWDLGNAKEAQADFNKAYDLGKEFNELAPYAAAGDMVAGDVKTGDQLLKDVFGTTNVDSDILSVAYYQTKNWPRLVALLKLRADKPGASAQAYFSLAAAYYTAGDSTNAIKTINAAVERFPNASSSAVEAIRQIRSGSLRQ